MAPKRDAHLDCGSTADDVALGAVCSGYCQVSLQGETLSTLYGVGECTQPGIRQDGGRKERCGTLASHGTTPDVKNASRLVVGRSRGDPRGRWRRGS